MPYSVLIVEDEPAVRQLMSILIESEDDLVQHGGANI
jgi:CheY-like chemotaxis protein